jgi:ubiquinone/menaquinone biosynthesis C-methylase UbiE
VLGVDDISETFVRIATENARAAGVDVVFRLGNASDLPLDADQFDLVYCRAAFKNWWTRWRLPRFTGSCVPAASA